MPEPSAHPLERHNPFGVFGHSFFGIQAFALLARWQNAPAPPTWDAKTLRTRLSALLEWVEGQPATGSAVPVAKRQWLRRWPIVPRSHPADPWMRAIGGNVRFALTLVEQGVLDKAQQVYANVVQAMDYLSAHLAEPHALRAVAQLKGASDGGQKRSDRYAPYRTQAQAEAERIWGHAPHLSKSDVIRRILKKLKPIDDFPLPSQRSIDRYIGHLNPHPQRRRPSS